MRRKINIVHRYPLLFVSIATILSLSTIYGKFVYNMFRSATQEEIIAYELHKQRIKEQFQNYKEN